jgi:hypothetical protein
MPGDPMSEQQKTIDYLHDLSMQMLRLSRRPGLEMTSYLLGMVVLDLEDRRSGRPNPALLPALELNSGDGSS